MDPEGPAIGGEERDDFFQFSFQLGNKIRSRFEKVLKIGSRECKHFTCSVDSIKVVAFAGLRHPHPTSEVLLFLLGLLGEEVVGQPHSYPWAILGHGRHESVENVTFVNAYQGIKMGDPDGSLHLIRNVFGCVLRRGILIDNTKDIGRLENIHFNPTYWLDSHSHSLSNNSQDPAQTKSVYDFLTTDLDAFTFGRSDWEYVTNTFVWGAKSGYLFTESPAGRCNGQFLGIGGDFCQVCVRIDKISEIGIPPSATDEEIIRLKDQSISSKEKTR